MKKKLLIALAALFIISTTASQAQQVFSTPYTMDQGLAANRVYSIVQDSFGYMWFGTDDGLCRFDGISFKTIALSEKLSSTTSNCIRTIFIDNKNIIWIGLDNGLVTYNPNLNTFQPFSHPNDEARILQSAYISDIFQDSDSEMWIATMDHGLFRFNPSDQLLTRYRTDSNNANSLSQNRILTIAEDRNKNIWIGTYSEGLNKFNKTTNQFKAYKKGTSDNAISDNSIQKIECDSHGNIWIGTFQNGLNLYHPESDTFSVFRDTQPNNGFYHIHDILEYRPGELLIASDNGVALFDVVQKRITQPNNTHPRIRSDLKYIYSMYTDKEGSLWLGTFFDGLEYYSAFQRNFEFFSCTTSPHDLAGRVVNVIREDANNIFWIGTDDDGIFQFDAATNTTKPFRTASHIGSTYYCIHDLLLDNNKLYAATYERGMEVFDLKTGKTEQFTHSANDPHSIPSSRIFSLFKSSDGKIYIGTSAGACLFNPLNKQFVRIGAPIGRISDIKEDHKGIIWIAGNINGLCAYNPRTGKSKVYTHNEKQNSLTKNAIASISFDSKNRLWIGTYGQGICRYNEATDDFVRYDKLALPNKIIASIIPTDDNLWISTRKGLVLFNPDTELFKTFTKSNGLINEQFTSKSGIVSHNGIILLGSNNGFCRFNPHTLQTNNYDPPVILSSMTIFGQEVQVGTEGSPLSQPIELTHKIVLSHQQSMVAFTFASLSYVAPNENHYRYILEGHDNKWRNSKGSDNSLSYSNLPPGNYTLRVEATNSDKVWSTNSVGLQITVLPPFYKSKWAYTLYTLILIAALVYILKWYEYRRKQQQIEHFRIINDQKEKELYDSKIEFFTNIAHEIRTPLSLIIGPIEYLIKKTGSSHAFSEYLSIIEQNHKRLFSLVNQLLDFRKVDSGAYHLSFNSYRLKELITNSIAIFEFNADQRHILIDTSGIPNDMTLVTDEEALTKVISNLVSNALKYAQSEITITASVHNNDVLITVTDDGSGIKDSEKTKIFDAFYQIKSSAAQNKLGVGIGLHLSMSLVRLMDGDIIVSDNTLRPSGTTITITLPQNSQRISEADINTLEDKIIIANAEAVLKEIQTNPEPTEISKKYIVLIVDDNPEILHFLSKVLSDTYFVISALSAEQALEILSNNKVDLIISDVVMEGMNGFEFCETIKGNINTSHIPVVLLTAKSDTKSKIDGLESGADAYIEKPFSPLQLMAQLHNLVSKKELLQSNYASTPLSEMYTSYTSKLDLEFMDKCSEIINSNIIDTKFSVTQLAQELNMSRTSLFTKIKGITGMTPNDFIKVYRLKKACRLMIEAQHRITEIVFLVGFNSSSYFAKCFQKQFGVLPTEYLKSIKKEGNAVTDDTSNATPSHSLSPNTDEHTTDEEDHSSYS